MANRAYLFFVDDPKEAANLNRNATRYFDSRHSVPFAWLLFFDPSDIRLLLNDFGSEELFLVAPWQEARRRFHERSKYLPLWFGGPAEPGKAGAVLAALEEDASKYLALDASGIIEDVDECEQSWRTMLLSLQAGTFDPRRHMGLEISLPHILEAPDEEERSHRIFGGTFW